MDHMVYYGCIHRYLILNHQNMMKCKLTKDNYKNNSLYLYKADYDDGKEKFSAYAMGGKSFFW